MLRSRGLGRLGLLAVGLGIGAAIASTPGVASADSSIGNGSYAVMGATGLPDPTSNAAYWADALAYVQADLPDSTAIGLTTPEDLSPMVGSLTFDESVSQGVTDLNNAISADLDGGASVGVLGVSQSAVIASQEMAALDPSGTPSDLPASFILLGDPMNPDGGIFERFPGLSIDGISFAGATPADDFPTIVYTHEYDPISDFCQYPVDVVCDVNAVAGIIDHSYTAADLANAVQLPTEGATETTYEMIPSEVPLLTLLQEVPVIGTPLADLVGPDLTDLVNLGFGNPDYGYSVGPADLPTPADLLPPATDLDMMPALLASGTEEGIQAFIAAIGL
jgi:PE-PPE domain